MERAEALRSSLHYKGALTEVCQLMLAKVTVYGMKMELIFHHKFCGEKFIGVQHSMSKKVEDGAPE
jgi:hypothetical protein